MKFIANCFYKGFYKKEAGEFTNEVGKVIQFKECYNFMFDEANADNTITSWKFKIDIDEEKLIEEVKKLSAFQEVEIHGEILCTTFKNKTSYKLKLTDIKVVD